MGRSPHVRYRTLVFLNGKSVRLRMDAAIRRLTGLLLLLAASLVAAQTVAKPSPPPESGITLQQVVQSAVRDYPQIHVSQEELNASVANIRLARTAYLPRVDGLLQGNRATRNNVFGTLLPETTIPTISGPVIGTNNAGSVWGSAAGVLVSWEPFDFGLRHANVNAARAANEKASAQLSNSELEVGSTAADAFLTLLAAEQAVKAGDAAVENWNTLLKSIHALASAQLKPGADESRVEAELAMARTQLVYAKQAQKMSSATLAKFLDQPVNASFVLNPGRFFTELPPSEEGASFQTAAHPLMREQRAAVAQSVAQLRATERTWVPQFSVGGAASARGSGAETSGGRMAGANGLIPTVQNYAVGVNVTFPFLGFAAIHAREAAQAAIVRADRARVQLIDKTITEQFERAKASLEAAREVANNTPVELRSAQMAFDQAKARYQAGLSPIDDLAEAQRLLVQAEIDDSIARLNVWRALLQLDEARGDIQPFLQAVSR